MSTTDPSEKQKLMAELLYNVLISTDRSEEFAVNFLKMTIKKRRMANGEIKKLSFIFAETLLYKLEKENDSEGNREKIINESLHETLKKYDQNVKKD